PAAGGGGRPWGGGGAPRGGREGGGRRAGLGLGAPVDREAFFPPFSLRDGVGREVFAQTVFSPVRGLDLRIEGAASHDQTVSRKYVKDTHYLGGGGVWSSALWRLDLGARSGGRQYPEAISGGSNFHPRHPRIQLAARAGRPPR